MAYTFVLIVGLVAGLLSGVVGTGSSMLLMPVLIVFFGPRQAVPIMAIAAIFGNLGKVIAWWREIDWRACAAYCSTAVPGAALGVRTLLALPPRAVECALGVFFVMMVPARRWLARRDLRLSLGYLALIGGGVGFLTGIVVSTGPLTVPIFIARGLVKGAFLATEALGSVAVYGAKVTVFAHFGALPKQVVLSGLLIGASLMTGSFAARYIVMRMPPRTFKLIVDGLMLSSGVSLLWTAIR